MANLVKRLSPERYKERRNQLIKEKKWLPNNRPPIHVEFGSFSQWIQPLASKEMNIEINDK
jgi:hypothetical protein